MRHKTNDSWENLAFTKIQIYIAILKKSKKKITPKPYGILGGFDYRKL